MGKLELQLSGTQPAIKKLMAEMIWLADLFPFNSAPPTKQKRVQSVWSWSGELLKADDTRLGANLLKGVGKAGMGFNAYKWMELQFLADAVKAFKGMAKDRQTELLSDPWAFTDWLHGVSSEGRQLKQILPFLLFPDHFERTATHKHKRQIVSSLLGLSNKQIKALSSSELNKRILEERTRLEAEEGKPIDFYFGPLKDRWRKKDEPTDAEEATSELAVGDRDEYVGPLNLILHGPPGTGKTYSVVDRAVRILDPSFYVEHIGERDDRQKRFDELRKEGRVEFITFHQSYEL